MKYIDDFRDGTLARTLAVAIAGAVRPDRRYNIMEFCGGHTHAIARFGLVDLLPPQVRLIHGPGCPVCVLPVGRVDDAIAIAARPGVILCTYADLMRVPGSGRRSLLTAKAEGADIRMVYTVEDALKAAADNPDREVVFFAIGFETTTPPTAIALLRAQAAGLANFSVFCNHVLTPSAMEAILAQPADGPDPVHIDAFVGPAHVSMVIGTRPYETFARDHGRPVVIAGFEPLDVMQAVLMLVRQINDGRAEVENEYSRAVAAEGNLKAQAAMARTLERRDSFEWRGLGRVADSALRLRAEFAGFDAERRFDVPGRSVPDPKSCECAAILRGQKRPDQCKLFGTACTPETPIGSCMVSSEGACAAEWTYGRFRGERRRA
jgi:hydrogenase expression/formation protein HypD